MLMQSVYTPPVYSETVISYLAVFVHFWMKVERFGACLAIYLIEAEEMQLAEDLEMNLC